MKPSMNKHWVYGNFEHKFWKNFYVMKVTILIVTIWKKDYAKSPIYQFLKISHHWNYCLFQLLQKFNIQQHLETCPLLKKVQKRSKDWGKIISIQSSFWMPRIFFFKYKILMIESRLPWGVWNLTHENSCRLVMFKNKNKKNHRRRHGVM